MSPCDSIWCRCHYLSLSIIMWCHKSVEGRLAIGYGGQFHFNGRPHNPTSRFWSSQTSVVTAESSHLQPRVGSRIVRIDALHFLAGCLILSFFWMCLVSSLESLCPPPFHLAASVLWCWSWEKEGRAVEVVPDIYAVHWKFSQLPGPVHTARLGRVCFFVCPYLA